MRIRILFSIGVLTGTAVLPLTLRGASVAQQPFPASDAQAKHAPIYVAWMWGRETMNQQTPSSAKTPGGEQRTKNQEQRTNYLSVLDQDDILEEHKRIADEVLRLLPERCQSTLTNFFVRYDSPENRGLAGKNTVVISGNLPNEEFRALLIHELGHVFDLSHDTDCLHGTARSGITPFRDGQDVTYRDDPSYAFYQISWMNEKTKKMGSSDDDFVTGYAAWDVYEDFAESFVYFLLQNEEFWERATQNAQIAQKYAWFQTYLFPKNPSLAAGRHEWNGRPPWDATKLAYEWHPTLAIAQNQ